MDCKAPPLDTPSPEIVIASETVYSEPVLYNSKVEPLATVVPPAVVPSADVLVALNVPAEIVVVPVYSFVPDKTRVPVPDFVKAEVV